MAYKSKTPEERARMRERCEALARKYRGSDEGTPTLSEAGEAKEAAKRPLEPYWKPSWADAAAEPEPEPF